MSSSVCQGLQSCLELRQVEPRLLRLKLAPPKPTFELEPMPSNEDKDVITRNNNINNINTGGWSSLQSLANANDSTQNDNVYVHPLLKRPALILSDKSLEMCTESLGSETGSEVSESSDDMSTLLSLESSRVYKHNNPSKPRESSVSRKKSRVESFPPPLTSISGSNGVKVESHREDGRLVLQAVSIPPCNRYFHADRSEGRLRLSIFKDVTAINVDDEEEHDREEVVENDDENGVVVVQGGVKEGSVMREVIIWKEIVGMLGVKLRKGNWKGQAGAKKVGVLCTKACLIGNHCWGGDYLKAKTWKISLNPRQNYHDWIP